MHQHPALGFVGSLHNAGTALAAACSGTFFLAEAGTLDETRTLTQDGNVTTAGAAFAHIHLALSIVQQQSPALADLVARYLVIGDRPSQAAFAVPSMLASDDPTMTAFEHWVRDHIAEPIQIGQLAGGLNVSERTL